MSKRSLKSLGAILTLGLVATIAASASATVVLSDSFSYPDGSLVGQGGWILTGTSMTNPIQVVSGQASLVTTGQDANEAFTAPVIPTTGGIYTGVDLNLSAAQATGDYFMHLNDSATSTNFNQRLFAKSSGSGYVLGLVETGGTGLTPVYGTNVLDFNHTYRVVVSWNFVPGDKNDTFAVYVDPASATESDNTAYLTKNWLSIYSEPAQLSTVNLRQGTASSAPTLTVDNLVVGTAFSEVIPEPATMVLLAVSCAGLLRRRF
jgi:trimeric autotransporter adhesin